MRLRLGNVERIAENESQAARLMHMGYVPMDAKPPAAEPVEAADLQGMDLKSLRGLAKDRGLTGADALSKKDLLAVLKDVI